MPVNPLRRLAAALAHRAPEPEPERDPLPEEECADRSAYRRAIRRDTDGRPYIGGAP